MKTTWRKTFRWLAATCAVSGATAWSSAMCYAQIAFDSADDPVYADGWQENENGGFGFGPWSFDGTSVDTVYNAAPSHRVDDGLKAGTQSSSPYNDIGQALTMYNYNARAKGGSNPPEGETDITRAGRALSTPLQVGQTISVVLDNPTEQAFFRGYNFKLNSGGANICFDGAPCTPGTTPELVWGVGTFEYFDYGSWDGTDLFDYHTDAGVRIDFTLTDPTSYSFTMTPLDDENLEFTKTGTLTNTDPIDWIEFQFYNTDSDFYPTMVPPNPEDPLMGPQPTDYYIRSITVTGLDPPGVPGDYNDNGVVDAADYTVWRDHLGENFQLENEESGVTPGMVTAADYNSWKANYNRTHGSGAGSLVVGGTVPEPGSLISLVAGVGGFIGFGLRRVRVSSDG